MELYCYVVTYDISSPRRWRKVYQTMLGFGEHVQPSVFRCDLTAERMVELKMILEALIRDDEDQVIIAKLGRSTKQVIGAIEVLGRPRQFRLPAPQVV